MAVPTGQRARRRRLQSVQSSLHSSCTSSLCSSLSGLRRILHSSWYWAYCRYWQYVRTVATRYGSIDATTATQLFNQHNLVFPPSGHWNPECTGRRKGTDLRTSKGHRPKERHFPGIPSGIVGGFSAAWFMAKPLIEVTTSWVVHVGCRYSFWSLFSRDS